MKGWRMPRGLPGSSMRRKASDRPPCDEAPEDGGPPGYCPLDLNSREDFGKLTCVLGERVDSKAHPRFPAANLMLAVFSRLDLRISALARISPGTGRRPLYSESNARTSEPDNGPWVRRAVDRYEGPLTLYAARLLGDADAARDVVQETFLRLCTQDRDGDRPAAGGVAVHRLPQPGARRPEEGEPHDSV